YTKRANSANAVAPQGLFEDVFRRAELRYGAQQLPLIFRISPLAGSDVDLRLEKSGFRRVDETLVMVATLPDNLPHDNGVCLRAHPDEQWSAGFADAHGISPHRRHVHDQILASLQQ